MKSSLRSIGDTAARFGLATHVLRHWEDVGLLAPIRDGAGRRRYGDDEVVRIAAILRSKAAGMGLEQIAVLLSDDHGPQRHRVLQEHLAELDRRMAEMQRSRAMAQHAFECEAHDLTRCPGFQATIADVLAGAPWPEDPAPAPASGANPSASGAYRPQ